MEFRITIEQLQNHKISGPELRAQFEKLKRFVDEGVSSQKIKRPAGSSGLIPKFSDNFDLVKELLAKDPFVPKSNEQNESLSRSMESRINLHSNKTMVEHLEVQKSTDLDDLIDRCNTYFLNLFLILDYNRFGVEHDSF